MELVEAATETAPLRPHERDGVVARAGGNPLFLEELLRIVRATDVEALPDTLDAVAMREIDALRTTPRRVLRLASVLGRSFDRSLLDQVLMAESVEVGADPLEDLRAQLVPEGDGERIHFRHALLQEAAYASLPFRQRLALHRTAGDTIERAAASADRVAPLLSLHFLAAQDWERAWRYALLAARVAQDAHAPGEAAIHLARAVIASRRLGDSVRDSLAAVFVDLGLMRELLGEYEAADDAYRQATRVVKQDPLLRARMAYRRARLRHEYMGRPSAAIRLLRKGMAELDDANPQAADLRALLLAEEANVRERQGHLSQALDCARRAIPEAERSGDKHALALSLEVLNSCLTRTGHAEDATYMDRVLELYEELGDVVGVAVALGNIAGQAFFASQWDRAADYVARSAEASALAGDLARAAMSNANLGELRANQGRLDEAIALLVPARRVLQSYGYRMMSAMAAMQLGRAAAFSGDLDEGLAMVRSAGATFDEIGSHIESLEARARLAEILVFGGRFAQAGIALEEARELERGAGETLFAPLIERVELTLAAGSGDPSTVFTRLDAFLGRAEGLGTTYEILVVLALVELLGDDRVHTEVTRLSTGLGVVTLPMLPGAGVPGRAAG